MNEPPQHPSSITKAQEIQKNAIKAGFKFKTTQDAFKKLEEEVQEFLIEKEKGTKASKEAEAGDILFSLLTLLTEEGIDAENALEKTTQKFIERFQTMETTILNKGKMLSDLSYTEKIDLWNALK